MPTPSPLGTARGSAKAPIDRIFGFAQAMSSLKRSLGAMIGAMRLRMDAGRILIMLKCFLAALVASMLMAGTANAEITLKNYKENRRDFITDKVRRSYLIGIGRGVFWANLTMAERQGVRLFCPPDKFAFDGKFFVSVITDYLDRATAPDSLDIELLAVEAFEEKFPCRT